MDGSSKRTKHFLIAFRGSQHLFNDLGSILDKLGAECVEEILLLCELVAFRGADIAAE